MNDFRSNYNSILSLPNDQFITTNHFKSSLISISVHCLGLGLLLLSPYLLTHAPEQQPTAKPESVRLYVPVKTPPPKHLTPLVARVERPQPPPRLRVPTLVPPAPKPKAVEVKPEPAPKIVASAPPTPALPGPPPKPEPPVQAKRPAPTEVFASAQPVVPHVKSRETHVGEFGDVNGTRPSESTKPSLLAKVGGFDAPQSGQAGSQGGSGHRAQFQQTAFGGPGDGGTSKQGGSGAGGVVKTGGFGDAAAVAQAQTTRAKPAEEKATPVEILAKPKPAYTAEARSLKVEGDVSLEVLFLASGQVQVIRVVHGLGHGLDEVAVHVAHEIQFRPSTRAGVPIDSKAIIRVTFELT